MKLAELCTVYPATAGAPGVRNPGKALPLALRLKLRAQRGHLQAALDSHSQRSANRLGLGLRPYESGDSLRALALRPLLLQEQLLTRTDVSPGRFHVSVVVHSYENMNFKSTPASPSKNQLTWALAGLLQCLHEQRAHKVEFIVMPGPDLPQQMIQHSPKLKRSHFCYVITDLFFNPKTNHSAAEELAAALNLLHLRRGIVILARDPFESPSSQELLQEKIFSFEPPTYLNSINNLLSGQSPQLFSGAGYVRNLRAQVDRLQTELTPLGWTSLLTTSQDEVSALTRQLALRLTGQGISQ